LKGRHLGEGSCVEGCAHPSTPGVVVDLEFVGKDPNSGNGECPSAWVDHDAAELVLQGLRPSDELVAACEAQGPVPSHELILRLPVSMVAVLRKACDAAERSALR
jgi:hypothetical protein